MKFNKDNYRYVDHTPKGSDTREIIALGSYLGSVVKGTAKCDPRDSFNPNVGEMLAALRCNFKIAEKRLHNSTDKVVEAQVKVDAAMKELEKATKYHDHAQKEYDEASKLLVDYEISLN